MGNTVVCIWKILPQMGEGTSRKCVYVRVETGRPWDEMVVVVVVAVVVVAVLVIVTVLGCRCWIVVFVVVVCVVVMKETHSIRKPATIRSTVLYHQRV